MFAFIKKLFSRKPAEQAAQPQAPYKIEPPVVTNSVASDNVTLEAKVEAVVGEVKAEPAKKAVKKSGGPKPRVGGAKKPAAKKAPKAPKTPAA